MKFKLHNLIFVGMILGVILGLTLHHFDKQAQTPTPGAATQAAVSTEAQASVAAAGGKPERPAWIADALWLLDLCGPVIFMGALKMIIAPLILASIVAGVTSLPNIRELGAIGWKTLVYYTCTTGVAVAIGLVFVLTLQPGSRSAAMGIRAERETELTNLRAEYERQIGKATSEKDAGLLAFIAQKSGDRSASHDSAKYAKIAAAEKRTAADMFRDDIVKPLLMNPFESVSKSPPNSLGVIFFALLLGIACTFVGEPARPVINFFQGMNEVILKITHWLMSVAPFAIMCIMAKLVAENGPEIFHALGWYCGTVIVAIFAHVIFLLAVCYFIGGVGPFALWRGLREAWMIAFTTRSSAATLPVTIANVTENLKVSPKVANFSLPLGATMNMDGTALYEGVAVIFLIQIYGGLVDVPFELTMGVTLVIFVTAVLASVGAAAVPDAGLVTMVLVAAAVGLPIYYIPLIFAVDAFLDMFRTSTNVLGDAIGAIVVNRMEGKRLETQPA
ncbi:MAG TPA: dicarboxylate/amino acid:cation symporter [Phycisphaerae bacterium]|nr:dicarboxylate/amino acid:cation symporter [Phycisphaerae bacterium]